MSGGEETLVLTACAVWMSLAFRLSRSNGLVQLFVEASLGTAFQDVGFHALIDFVSFRSLTSAGAIEAALSSATCFSYLAISSWQVPARAGGENASSRTATGI